MRNYKVLAEEEFRDSLNTLTIKTEKVVEAKDDVEAGLVAELETESDTTEVPLLTKEGDQKSNPGNSPGQLWKH